MIRFQDLQMSHEAKSKWVKATIDTRIVLQMAFSDILRRPELVAYYEDFGNYQVDVPFLQSLYSMRIQEWCGYGENEGRSPQSDLPR
jgi:hypothetical protein